MRERATAPAIDSTESRAVLAVLDAVSKAPPLHRDYVLKGGLALHLAYGSPRFSKDLDFNAVRPTANEITPQTEQHLLSFSQQLNRGLSSVAPAHEFAALQTAREQFSTWIPTLLTEVVFEAYSGERGAVKLQLTLSEIVCDADVRPYEGIPVHVASLEDILAEKLKALLQQATREQVRSSDVFDLWYFTTISAHDVEPAVVTQYVLEKSKQWRKMPQLRKSQFRRKSIYKRASMQYGDLEALLRGRLELPPFREAFEAILRFVDRLDLPE